MPLAFQQLERRNPEELVANDRDLDDLGGEEDQDRGEDEDKDEDQAPSSDEDDDGDGNNEDAQDLPGKIQEALRVNGLETATGSSDEESEEDLMDDDRMMAIDEQIA